MMRIDLEGDAPQIHADEGEEVFTCWYVLAIVFMSAFFMICILYYQRLCHCLFKRGREGFVHLNISQESLDKFKSSNNLSDNSETIDESSTYYELKRMDCGCCEVLLNTGFRVSKLVYVKDGEKTTYEATGDSPKPPRSSYNKTCAVCLEEFEKSSKIIRLACAHAYHKRCIRQWIMDKDESICPLCGETIIAETVTLDGGGMEFEDYSPQLENFSRSAIYSGRRATLPEMLMGTTLGVQ